MNSQTVTEQTKPLNAFRTCFRHQSKPVEPSFIPPHCPQFKLPPLRVELLLPPLVDLRFKIHKKNCPPNQLCCLIDGAPQPRRGALTLVASIPIDCKLCALLRVRPSLHLWFAIPLIGRRDMERTRRERQGIPILRMCRWTNLRPAGS